ncbi:MAG TPA: ABC transporter ATP-binding protein [Candidatus Eisenbacteria bacterium]|nr:ABC transporter ATP-binding protein [Candidatus Eisenbacteria bacterium]
MDCLVLNRVSKRFGGVSALDDVSFSVAEHQVLGIIGLNGSGKTTVVNAITGFIEPDSGEIWFKGTEITGFAPHRVAAAGIARTFQTVRPFHNLPAFKNLIVPLYSPRIRKRTESGRWGDRDAVALDLLEEVGFERDSHVPYKPASTLPHGYLRRLELARCLALRPDLLITDELFSGLSAAEVGSMLPLIEKLQARGMTIVMVEHRLRELFRLAHRVVVLDRGRKIAEGSPREIVESSTVKETYLGAELSQ